MRVFLAFVLPPLAVLLCGRPLHAVLNVLLTACFWIPGVLHALVIVQGALYDKQTARTIRRMEAKIAEHRPDVQPVADAHRRRAMWKQAAAGLATCLAVYVFSYGPVLWLAENGHLPKPVAGFVEVAYIPLQWTAERSDWLTELIKWYRNLWTR